MMYRILARAQNVLVYLGQSGWGTELAIGLCKTFAAYPGMFEHTFEERFLNLEKAWRMTGVESSIDNVLQSRLVGRSLRSCLNNTGDVRQ
jgi:hypothetical protein